MTTTSPGTILPHRLKKVNESFICINEPKAAKARAKAGRFAPFPTVFRCLCPPFLPVWRFHFCDFSTLLNIIYLSIIEKALIYLAFPCLYFVFSLLISLICKASLNFCFSICNLSHLRTPSSATYQIVFFKLNQLLQIVYCPLIIVFTTAVNQKRCKALFSCSISFRLIIIHIDTFSRSNTLCL